MSCWVRLHDARTDESIMRPEEIGRFAMIKCCYAMIRYEWDGKQPNHCISNYCKADGVGMGVCASWKLLHFSSNT